MHQDAYKPVLMSGVGKYVRQGSDKHCLKLFRIHAWMIEQTGKILQCRDLLQCAFGQFRVGGNLLSNSRLRETSLEQMTWYVTGDLLRYVGRPRPVLDKMELGFACRVNHQHVTHMQMDIVIVVRNVRGRRLLDQQEIVRCTVELSVLQATRDGRRTNADRGDIESEQRLDRHSPLNLARSILRVEHPANATQSGIPLIQRQRFQGLGIHSDVHQLTQQERGERDALYQ